MQKVCVEESNDASKSTGRTRKIDWRLAAIAILLLGVSVPAVYGALASYAKGVAALQYKKTDGKVLKVVESFDAFGVTRQVSMRFWINGAEQTALCAMPPERVMKTGELTVLFYDPNNPANVALTQDIDYDPIMVFGAFGMFGVCLGVFIARKTLEGRALF